ncbi:hypothetical protein LTR53_013770 [Teratosphaeriaceae sp. CCFEE 6253]|nr:hypothetical protein LTR53_013770 [Teratosphaeriaceae sp. CCFEE 6253]
MSSLYDALALSTGRGSIIWSYLYADSHTRIRRALTAPAESNTIQANSRTRSSSPYRLAMASTSCSASLCLAQNSRVTAARNLTAARNASVAARNALYACLRQVAALRKAYMDPKYQHMFAKQWHANLCRRLEAHLRATHLTREVSVSAELLVIREKELKQAHADQIETKMSIDACWLAQGKLKRVQSERTNAAGPVAVWRETVRIAFGDYKTMNRSPTRGTHVCAHRRRGHGPESSRHQRLARPIEACECAIRAALRGDINLRVERLRWMHENFPVEMKAKAGYVHGIVQGMYDAVSQA